MFSEFPSGSFGAEGSPPPRTSDLGGSRIAERNRKRRGERQRPVTTTTAGDVAVAAGFAANSSFSWSTTFFDTELSLAS